MIVLRLDWTSYLMTKAIRYRLPRTIYGISNA